MNSREPDRLAPIPPKVATPARPDDTGAPAARPRRRNVTVVIAVVATLYALFLVYPPLRLLHLIHPERAFETSTLLAVIALPLLVRVSHEWWPNGFTRYAASLAMGWLGACFIAFLALVPAELSILTGAQPQPMGLATLMAAMLFTGWALLNAQLLRVRQVDVHGKGKAKGRLVQISDVHIGSRSPALLARIVRKVNAQQPDVLLITGDFIDFRNIGEAELAALRDVRAPTYFVIGNHERYVDLEAICQRMQRLGVRVLRNDTGGEGPFHFLGIDDAESRAQVARELPGLRKDPDRFQVLLYHRPDGLEAAAEAGVDLMLCGHTHNGQIIPFNFLVRRVFPRIVGLHELGGTTLYVSPGTGTWGPVMRLGTRCEITVFDVR